MQAKSQRFQPRGQHVKARFWQLLTVLLVSSLLAACTGTDQAADRRDASIGVGDVLADPARYRGQQLTLSGEVSDALSVQVFRMTEATDGLVDSPLNNDGLLVVLAESETQSPALSSEMLVQVTGEVQAYNAETLATNIGTSFIPAVEGISEGDPMLLAERVLVQATLRAIDENPGAYVNNEVTVSGRVTELISEGIVSLEDAEGGDVLVVVSAAEPQLSLSVGQELVVTGQVRQFNLEEIGGEFDLDLDSGIFAGWASRAVIIAETVEEG